ncbi:DNA/RNA non-specific endonuclease [Rhodococcus opacus]|uniref:DNA/RNA non-specific endonuclease n=1 Tax=Rhodococcus opacus TaxID=37919 RepID=UPI002948FE80|nr:DNA/RNA non-specific endonuclease [Rhodococcus opacus]MDV6241308.1 DNA/RNA non-specific endonuclease [Rhodococcus opacus]
MTIVDNIGDGQSQRAMPGGTFEAEWQRQRDAAELRARERAPQRGEHVDALNGPGGVAAADTPERIAKRVDRLGRYYGNGDWESDALPDRLLEKIINTADFVGVRYLDAGAAAARSIGRVNIRDARGTLRAYGTGFLVSPTLLLTNHHVLPNADTARSSVIEFDYQDGIDGKPRPVQMFPLDPGRFYLADRERDFALVAVGAEPGTLAQFGFNPLIQAEGKAVIGEFVTIVQHPRGEKKQIALRENRIVDIPERFLHYSADTEPGSSGSPVFNDQWEVVALHHASVRAPQHTEFGGVLNEGVRISRILEYVRAQNLAPQSRDLVDDIVRAERTAPTESPAVEHEREVTVRVPLEITVRLGSVDPPVSARRPAEPEAISIDPNYSTRGGYDANFLRVPLPLPRPGTPPVASPELTYHHFSVVMHRERALALFTAVNIDGTQSQSPRRDSDRWILDPRLPADQQTGEDVYRDNPLDRGHLVRRLDPAWGPLAKAANDDTFHFTNCTPQHHSFNAGQTLWLGLEDYVLKNADNADLAVSVVTGPVLAPDDPEYRGVALPRQFWKTVAMVKQDGGLSVTGYLLSQAALLDEFAEGEEAFSYGAYRTFQVPVRRIAQLTGLVLDPYIAADPLERIEASALPRELIRPQDLIL